MKNFHNAKRRSAGDKARPGIVLSSTCEGIKVPGYTNLADNPDIEAAVHTIAQLIGSITIHLMNHTDKGDERIINELSRMIDITPHPALTRMKFMDFVISTLLVGGRGNAVVLPHTRAGLLKNLEPIAGDRVSFLPVGRSDYRIQIDGKQYRPNEVLHFTFAADDLYPWKGKGITASVSEIAKGLRQAQATKTGFLSSEYKPSLIIKVDAMDESFNSPDKRKLILDDYIEMQHAGQPWIIPGEQFDIETIKPLTLKDLAISEDMELDKKTVAAVLGVPPFLLGVGTFKQEDWNNFIQRTIKPICDSIAQEMTNKLIISPNWYLKFNTLSLMAWDIKQTAEVFCALNDRGIVDGNEVRDRIGMSPRDGLDELIRLENYIPNDMAGQQKKLEQ